MIRLAFALLLAMVPFGADANRLFVSPNGSDEGQCESREKPCATTGRACSVANGSTDRETTIEVAGGMYEHNTSCNIRYHRIVVIFGDCNNHPDIVLFGNDVAFHAQDSAILGVNCVGIRSLGSHSIMILATQASWVGAFFGQKYICIDSQIDGATTMPGTHSSLVNNCLIR